MKDTTKNADAFVENLLKDEAFASKLAECKNSQEAFDKHVTAEGYSFTEAELEAALARKLNVPAVAGGALSEEQLAEVSGGGIPMSLLRKAVTMALPEKWVNVLFKPTAVVGGIYGTYEAGKKINESIQNG
jgi:predicted ribosomally synthesized peptide with nif11-like leader